MAEIGRPAAVSSLARALSADEFGEGGPLARLTQTEQSALVQHVDTLVALVTDLRRKAGNAAFQREVHQRLLDDVKPLTDPITVLLDIAIRDG